MKTPEFSGAVKRLPLQRIVSRQQIGGTMETKHTPGPWKCVPWGTNETHVVKMVSENTEESIAFVESVNAAADAKLIAAAPLMLEALQMAFDCDLTYLSDHAEIPRQDVVRARLAIRAALGYDG